MAESEGAASLVGGEGASEAAEGSGGLNEVEEGEFVHVEWHEKISPRLLLRQVVDTRKGLA